MLVPNLIVINYPKPTTGANALTLPLAEFAYNNNYQESIKMAPFEALYGRKCRTPLNWIEPGERRYYSIDFVEEVEKKVHIIQQNMRAAQSRQKSYADI
jgi:hypothetical protein